MYTKMGLVLDNGHFRIPCFVGFRVFLRIFFLITENTGPVAFKYEIKYKINMYMDRNYIPNLLAHPFALHISKHS